MMIGTGSFRTDEIFESTAAAVYFVILAFVLGTVFGSFMNCMAWRMVHGEKVTRGKSHCAVCGHALSAADLVPVFSYLALRGRCRYCHEKISPRYMITELISGTAFAACLLRFGISVETVRAMALCCILLGLSLVDLDTLTIPDRFPAAGILVWAVTVPFLHTPWQTALRNGLIGAFAIAGGMLAAALIFDKIAGRESLGGGDLRLYFLAGLYLGPANGLLCVIVSCLIGLVCAAAMRKGKREAFPFGPSISAAIVLCLLFGQTVVDWYLGLLMI